MLTSLCQTQLDDETDTSKIGGVILNSVDVDRGIKGNKQASIQASKRQKVISALDRAPLNDNILIIVVVAATSVSNNRISP